VDSGLLDLLVDPVDGGPLSLGADGLTGPSGTRYAVCDGVPRFPRPGDPAQDQTGGSFAYKWSRQDTYESAPVRGAARAWFLARYGFADGTALRRHLAGRRFLDLGCGAGFSSSLWLGDDEGDPWRGTWIGVDVGAAIDLARERLGGVADRHFVQADALALPFRPGTFDAVLAEGVLHHTASTRDALAAATEVLAVGGEILFYVYRRKGPLREFSDDHVRGLIADLSPEDAWEALRPLTRLGEALAATGATVEIPEEIAVLGIPAGTYDVQRLFNGHVAKVFWNATYTFEENHHANFDWYHPHYAHRQSEDEVRSWCWELGLRIVRFDVQESGCTVRAIRDRSVCDTDVPGQSDSHRG
jgi:SAM-dependent methyltransferase